jgi:hypothetical protein
MSKHLLYQVSNIFKLKNIFLFFFNEKISGSMFLIKKKLFLYFFNEKRQVPTFLITFFSFFNKKY